METNGKRSRRRQKYPAVRFPYFTDRMRRKLLFLFVLILILFTLPVLQIIRINRGSANTYRRKVLEQQTYGSTTLPYKRGTITDANGTVLATSELVYNVIIEAKQMLEDDGKHVDVTISALQSAFSADPDTVRGYIRDNPDSQYYILAKNVSYQEKKAFDEIVASQPDTEPAIQGVSFEEAYIRKYPNNALASDVIGFTDGVGNGSYGLEQYYNDILNGTTGRSYGYIDSNADLTRTTIPATDGDNLELTLDANIQSIVEKHLSAFNEEHRDAFRTGNGARNLGCVIMNPNTGAVYAMASTPGYDLNDPYDTAPLVGMSKLDFANNDAPTLDEYLTQEDVDALTGEERGKYLSALWKNFCVSDYYEPGSVAKPFTAAAGLETNSFSPTQTYVCNGSLVVDEGTDPIKCHNTFGDGVLTVGEAIERSCNVALMQMALAEGKDVFTHFQNTFGFGIKTNIDLANEARTDSFLYTTDKMTRVDLATNSFGQNFDVTMIQMISSFASLINGGNYYQPHLVSRITNASGAVVENIEPHIIRHTISAETSDWIRSYCNLVVSGANGTGHTARPAGYTMGGKTGTAETIPRNMHQYVVSFMGYVPADDPQVLIYVVVDRVNDEIQDNARFATLLVHDIMTEVLPYLGIPMTEPLSDEEKAELRALQASGGVALGESTVAQLAGTNDASAQTTDGTGAEAADGTTGAADGTTDGAGTADGTGTDGTGDGTAAEQPADGTGENAGDGTSEPEKPWLSFPYDEAKGLYINPETGNYVDADGHEYDVGPDTQTQNTDGTADGTGEGAADGTADGTAAEQPADGTGGTVGEGTGG